MFLIFASCPTVERRNLRNLVDLLNGQEKKTMQEPFGDGLTDRAGGLCFLHRWSAMCKFSGIIC